MSWETGRDVLIVTVALVLLSYQVVGPQNVGIITLLIGLLVTPAALRVDAARRRQNEEDHR